MIHTASALRQIEAAPLDDNAATERRAVSSIADARPGIADAVNSRALHHLGVIPLPVEARFGQLSMKAARIARLQPGDIIPLQRSTGDSIELCVNGVSIAWGEIVFLEGIVGLRITNFAWSPQIPS